METIKVVFFTLEAIVGIALVILLFANNNSLQQDDSISTRRTLDLDFKKLQSSISVDENLKVSNPVYVILYVGDIDGDVSEEWYQFYGMLVDFYERNSLKGTFSFYPTSLTNDKVFTNSFLKMYNSRSIDLMHKGLIPGRVPEEQVIFKDYMKSNGISNPRMPISYTELGGTIRERDLSTLSNSGIKVYFDVYYNDRVGPVKSTDSIDVLQYGVSFTDSGSAGFETEFIQPEQIFEEISDYKREDLSVIEINGVPVVPLFIHKQDFESKSCCDKIDEEKLKIYIETLLTLKRDPNVKLITVGEMYALLH